MKFFLFVILILQCLLIPGIFSIARSKMRTCSAEAYLVWGYTLLSQVTFTLAYFFHWVHHLK